MTHERTVREFYDSARHCYQSLMGDRWHHGDPEAEAKGLSPLEACQILEEKLVSSSGLRAGDRALDFGSGIGGPALHMAKLSGAYFVGVTNNEQLNLTARKRAEDAGLADRACFVTVGDTDYKSLPAFADGSFDAVTFYESVCHLTDKKAFFRSAFRVLKPGGRLVGIDWLQRPFGAIHGESEIMRFMQPVNEHICIPAHGTVDSYARAMRESGFRVEAARDLFEGVKCWGSTPDSERPLWLNYEGPEADRFRKGKLALDAAREAGVFTVGLFVASKPGPESGRSGHKIGDG
jgi:tocopherol O-methyltransferase